MSRNRCLPIAAERSRAAQSLQRGVRVQVEAEMRGLHRDLGVEASLLDQVEEPQVVLDDGVGVGRVLDVLAEDVNVAGIPFRRESFRRLERILHPLAGHESRDDRADEPESREMLASHRLRAARRIASRAGFTRRMASISRAGAEAGFDRPVHVAAPAPRDVAIRRTRFGPPVARAPGATGASVPGPYDAQVSPANGSRTQSWPPTSSTRAPGSRSSMARATGSDRRGRAPLPRDRTRRRPCRRPAWTRTSRGTTRGSDPAPPRTSTGSRGRAWPTP